MQWLLDRSTRAKLFLGFGLIILLLVAVIATAYTGITTLQAAQQRLYEKDFTIAVALKDIRANQNAINANVLLMLLETSPSSRERAQQDITERQQSNDEVMQPLLNQTAADPMLRAQLEEFDALRRTHRETWHTEVIPLILGGNHEEAKGWILGIQEERNQQMRSLATEFVNEAEHRAQVSLVQAEQSAQAMLFLFGLAGLVALLTAAGVSIYFDQIIADPLKEMAGVAERVSAGDLTVALPLHRRADEVGTLVQTFGKMMESLRELSREIREGVTVLAASLSEVMAATAQVASGTVETATAINETTTTVEEVRQSAHLVNQKAKQVADSAQRSVQVSQAGKQAVDDTIQDMRRIDEQMDSITESIVRLSEQSQAIGEIIATVNDLAEQSNLLAVNAAIEAAKAGEQGRGFAVVAREIKSLAEQSKQATAQVRTILGDIQKATSAAVMATEQGSKAVEAGVKQSAEADTAIRLLTESIDEAAQAAIQIAASNQQQLVGMEQVAQAMENIRAASAQNASSTKQVEMTAQDLHELGQKLKRMVEQFNV